jgi:glycosyltransferase involved in cell wall biosynthesis
MGEKTGAYRPWIPARVELDLRIGVLTTSFPRYAGDFAGGFVEDAVRACASTGDSADVIAAGVATRHHALGTPQEDARDNPTLELGPRVTVQRVPMPAVPDARALFFGSGAPETLESGGFGSWIQAGFFWAALCERVRERAPFWDRIVAHWLVPSALAARAVAPHLPLTAYAHSGDVALLERIPAGAALGRRLARETDDLIFVSSDLQERFSRLTGRIAGRVSSPSLGRAPGHTASRRENERYRQQVRAQLGMRRRTLLSVGRLVPIKGFDILLRAVATAAAGRRAGRDFMTVAIVGEGPERPRLERMASRMDIDLLLPGRVARSDVARWMAAADLYVQPSRPLSTGRTEGLPVATLEALEAGLPVIASRTGGLAELDGSGVQMVPPENVAALGALVANFAGGATPTLGV